MCLVPSPQYGLADSLGMRLTDYYVKVGVLCYMIKAEVDSRS